MEIIEFMSLCDPEQFIDISEVVNRHRTQLRSDYVKNIVFNAQDFGYQVIKVYAILSTLYVVVKKVD